VSRQRVVESAQERLDLAFAPDEDTSWPFERMLASVSLLRRAGTYLVEIERRVLTEDRSLQVMQRAARLDAELIDKKGARVSIHSESLGLTARAIQGEHQLASKPLAERMLGDERLELTYEVGVATELEVGLDPLFHRHEAKLFEPGTLAPGKRLRSEFAQSWTAPEFECLTEGLACSRRLTRSKIALALPERTLETVKVELVDLYFGDVARWARHKDALREHLAQAGDVRLDHLDGFLRLLVTPQLIDETFDRYRVVCVEK